MSRRTPSLGRRAFLAGAAGVAGGLAGCADAAGLGAPPTATPEPVTAEPIARSGVPQTICEEAPVDDPGIYAVVEPRFGADWAGLDVGRRYGTLDDETVVVGVERGGRARAYPLAVLFYHEVVNDDLGGPLLVTYCPLCRSGLVADRLVAGAPTRFVVSGLLWRPEAVRAKAAEVRGRVFGATRSDGEAELLTAGNLVMVDEATGSYWSQLIARAICGPRRGDELTVVPSSVARWGAWRAAHPDGEVLLPPPHSTTV